MEPTYQSQVNPKLEYSSKLWIASLQNTGCKLGGHARIVLEGVRNETPFVGQYEVGHYIEHVQSAGERFQKMLGNIPGVISAIRILEEENYRHDYTKHPSKSWFVTPDKAEAMIAKVKEVRATIEKEAKEYQETNDIRVFTYRYQKAGSERVSVLGGNGGDSCVTMAEKWLDLARAGRGSKPLDSIKASPEAHVRLRVGWPVLASVLGAVAFVGMQFARR